MSREIKKFDSDSAFHNFLNKFEHKFKLFEFEVAVFNEHITKIWVSIKWNIRKKIEKI